MADAAQIPEDAISLRFAYLLSMLAPSRPFTILDIGANPLERPAYQRLLEAGGCKVIGFEPQEAAFDRLQAAAGPNESYIKAAVGKAGKALLHLYRSSGMVSLFAVNPPSLAFLSRPVRKFRNAPTVELELQGMDDISEIPEIDMLKMDVQGAELDILLSGQAKLGRAVVVIPDLRYYRLYQGEPLMGEVDSELRRQGFELHRFLALKRVHLRNSQSRRLNTRLVSGQLIDGDAVYIRNMEDINSWSDDQLRFLALAAATVFDSQDLALRCMDHLVARKVLTPDCPAKYVDLLPAKLVRQEPPLEET